MTSTNLPNSYSDKEIPISESTEIPSSPLIIRATAIDSDRFPDLSGIHSVILKEGSRSRKEAKYTAIKNRHTDEVHHYALNIKTFKKKQGQWGEDIEHSVTLTTEENEIQKLINFLQTVYSIPKPTVNSELLVVKALTNSVNREALRNLINDLSLENKASALSDLLEFTKDDANLLQVLLERVRREPELFADAAAAMNLAAYTKAVTQLRNLINSDKTVREAEFQELLSENPWMFGSEYSELLNRRRWTRDEQQDFVLRRTTDNYIELVEIKTPLEGKPLFIYDHSHRSYYSGTELSKVVGQVQKYIEKLDAERNSIKANDGEDVCKIRAKIIIGRDSDQEQKEALRRCNAHLQRIEVLTFDQLLRIAESVLNYLQGVVKPNV